MSANKEKRQYERLESRYILNCRKFTPGEKGVDCGVDGVTHDISPAGILFEAPVPYDQGDTLIIEITLPGWDDCRGGKPPSEDGLPPDVHSFFASVIRCVANPDGFFEVAVCFRELVERDKLLLRDYLKNRHNEYDA
ncbi:MAG: PilZ domain-containing protein [Elusimicrobiaceae bacterium]